MVKSIRATFVGTSVTMIGVPGPGNDAHIGFVRCRWGDGSEAWLPTGGLLWDPAVNPFESLPQVV